MTEFEQRMKKFNRFYLWLIIGLSALSVAAIVTAVYYNAFVGILLGICVLLAYNFTLRDELRRSLGVSYKRVEGGISLTPIAQKSKKEAEIIEKVLPSRLMWLDVVAISAPEKDAVTDTRTEIIFIPSSVTAVDENAFEQMSALRRIVYDGSSEAWQGIFGGVLSDAVELVFSNESNDEDIRKDATI